MKVLFYNFRSFDEPFYADKYAKQFGITYETTDQYPSVETAKLAAGYDVVCIIASPTPSEVIEAWHACGVRYILSRAIGIDRVDLEAVRRCGMRLSHVVYSPDSVANFAIMLMLMCCRKAVRILRRADLQDYTIEGKIGRELSKSTVGVIGTGNIGRTVLRHLSGFGCRLLCYDVYENEEAKQYATYLPLSELLAESDLVTLHIPLTEQTKNLINRNTIAQMKQDAILINTARGGLVDSEALLEGLESGHIAAAGLDVVEPESGIYFNYLEGSVLPSRTFRLLRSCPNVILSPHIAFYTDQSVDDTMECVFRSVKAFEQGQPIPYEVK